MGIGLITGIGYAPSAKARLIDPELTAAADIEASGRAEDDSYSPDRRPGAGAEDAEAEPEGTEQNLAEERHLNESEDDPMGANKVDILA